MKRSDVLDKAKAITVDGERDGQERTFQTIAELWEVYLNELFKSRPSLKEEDVCMLMILLKVSRFLHGVNRRDSLIDIAGYAACAADYVDE